jgi:hypothetical protein
MPILNDLNNASGVRPVIFDIIAPDGYTSLLNDGQSDLRLVLQVNPKNLKFSYTKKISRTQTFGGFIETHWGDEPITTNIETSTGGFIRVGVGTSAITGAVPKAGGSNLDTGTRMDTLAYDKYLDFLALFHNNGALYDAYGNIVVHGRIKMSFNGGTWFGWFQTFTITDSAETPFQFALSAGFQIEREVHEIRTQMGGF